MQECSIYQFKDFSFIKEKTGAKDKVYIKIKGKIFELQGAKDILDGNIAMGLLFRKMLGIGSTISDEVNFEYMYDRQPPKSNLTHIKFKVTCRDRTEKSLKFEDIQFIEELKKFVGTPMNISQNLFLYCLNGRFSFEASELEIDPLGPMNENEGGQRHSVNFGFLANDTNIEVFSEDSIFLKITSKVMKAKALTKFGFNFNEMGVGGLDQEISNIFRRAFTTRLYPSAYLEKYMIVQ